MNIAILLITEKVIRLVGKGYVISSPNYTTSGKLKEFKIERENNTYEDYIYNDSYSYLEKKVSGYCKLSALDQYKNNQIGIEDFINNSNWFDNSFELAQIGDVFEIEKVDFYNSSGQRDFVHYFNQFKYRFRITKLNINFSNSAEYPPLNSNLNEDNYSVKTHTPINLNDTITGKFYKKNFGDKITDLQTANVSDKDIEQMAYYMVYICSKIFWILEENLMQVFAINDLGPIRDAVVDKYVNSVNTAYDSLPFIDKIIGELRKDWGLYHTSGNNLSVKDFFPTINISLLIQYYNSLHGFYNKITLLEENTLFKYDLDNNPLNDSGVPLTTVPQFRQEKDSDRRVTKMISLLPSIGFSLFPPQFRLKLLDKALEYSEIYENRPKVRTGEDYLIEVMSSVISPALGYLYDSTLSLDNSLFIEEDIIKLVASFNTTYEEANLLLNFLLELKNYEKNTSITKYERLYNLIDDKGIDNIAIANLFVSEENNRGRLILVLYEIWQKSIYFFYSQPPGVALNSNGTNPQNYFLFTTEGNNYYADYNQATGAVIPGTGSEPLLEFESIDLKYGSKFLVKYIPDRIVKEKIIVNKKFIFENYFSDYIPNVIETGYQIPEINHGSYHLYQTISLIGFKLDEDLSAQAPQINLGLIPAFLFHYVNEFDRLKNVYAGISLAVEITLEVGLFFATAGSSAALSLRHLRHLRHITKLGRITTVTGTLESGVVASEVLFTFRVAEGAAEIVSMTAGVASSYLSYLATVNDNAFQRRLSYFFMAFALASAGGAIYSNRKVVKMADDILNPNLTSITLINHLQSTRPLVYNLLQEVAGKKVSALTNFSTNLANMPTNRISDFYDGLSEILKPKFFEDFGNLGTDLLSKIDFDQVLLNWKKLADVNAAERKFFDIINKSNRTVTLEKFYLNSPLRSKIEILEISKKIDFIDSFKNPTQDMINKFLEKPESINRWLVSPAQSKLLAKNNPELYIYIVDDLPIGTNFSKVKSSTNWQLIDTNGFVHFRASLTGPPPPVNFESYIKFKKLSYAQQNAKRLQAETTFTNNAITTSKAYTNPITFQGQLIPRSRAGAGVSPTFKNLNMAFQPSPAVNVLGNGNNVIGLSESLQSLTQKIKTFKGEVKIPITGSRGLTNADFANAWLKMGISPSDGKLLQSELELTWHHIDDLDINMNSTMQLVTRAAHEATFPHSGSVKQAEVLFNLINNP